MAKLSKKEKEKIKIQTATKPDRGNTWNGIRPTKFRTIKKDKKIRRAESKTICNRALLACC